MRKLTIPPEFDQASIDERIEFVQDLWDRIAANPDELPIPEEHLRIIEERLRESPTSPESSMSWDEVKAHFRRAIKGRKP
jgi:putative addiction module component (TIGR02574 family)